MEGSSIMIQNNNFSETYDYDGDGDCGDEDDYNTWEILNSYLV